MRILACLHEPDSHPTVEEIYQRLSPEITSLSKATIYNTLHTFVEAGLARTVGIDEGELHYDLTVSDHGHFKCCVCGKIYNFEIPADQIQVQGLDHFEITEKNIYFRGKCPNCLTQPTPSGKEILNGK